MVTDNHTATALRRWGAVLGVVLAVSRAFIVEAGVACQFR